MFNQYNKGSHVFDSKLTITKEEASHFLWLTADKAMDYIAAKGANCLTTNITGVGTSLFNVILHKNKNDIHLGLITKILDKYEKEISNIPMSELMPFMVDLLDQKSYKSFAVIAELINHFIQNRFQFILFVQLSYCSSIPSCIFAFLQ